MVLLSCSIAINEGSLALSNAKASVWPCQGKLGDALASIASAAFQMLQMHCVSVKLQTAAGTTCSDIMTAMPCMQTSVTEALCIARPCTAGQFTSEASPPTGVVVRPAACAKKLLPQEKVGKDWEFLIAI